MSRKTIRVALVVCITCLLICTVASAEETLALYAGDGDTGALFTGDYEAGVRYSGTGSASVTTPASNALTPTSGWNVTTIDSSGNSNVYVSLGFDASGVPSVAYVRAAKDSTGGLNLVYATHPGKQWETEVINSSGNLLPPVSLAINSSGCPHIVYGYISDAKTNHYGLIYTFKNTGGSWETEVLPTVGETSGDASLAMNSSDYPCIAYIDAKGGYTLHYLYKNASGWQDEIVDDQTDLSYPVLRLDRSGNPHIAYSHDTGLYTSEKWYATCTNVTQGTWTRDKVAEGNLGWHTGLALSSSGNPAISYTSDTSSTTSELYYAPMTYTGSFAPTLVSTGHYSGYTSLLYDAVGRPHLAYFLLDNSGLTYSLNHAYRDSVGWHNETVATNGEKGQLGGVCDFQYDKLGVPHITYAATSDENEPINYAIKYATHDGVSIFTRPSPVLGPVSPGAIIKPISMPNMTTIKPKITPVSPSGSTVKPSITPRRPVATTPTPQSA